MIKLEIIFKTIFWLVMLAIVIAASIWLKGCLVESNLKEDIRSAQKAIYNARFPNTGDRIELDGKEIVILKRYFWSTERRYEVRLPNGEITDVLGSEIIDKKPIGEKDEH